MDEGPARLFAFVILFLLSGYFAGAEISLASVNKIRLATHAENGDKAAKRVLYILDNFDKALSTLLIGNNIAHAAIATLSTVVTYDFFSDSTRVPDWAVPVCTVVTTVAVFFLGEMIPKCFAKSCNEKFAKAISRSLIFLMKVLTPLSFVFSAISTFISRPFKMRVKNEPTVTEDELYDIIDTYVEENDIDEETEELVQNAIEFESPVRDVMTPWDKVVKISLDTPTDAVLDIARTDSHSRFPVVDENGDVVGTLRIRSFLKAYVKKGTCDITDMMSKPEFISDSIAVDDLLTALSSKRTHIAYVRSNKKVIGIITVEDILEELVGEIYDEDEQGGAVC